MSVHWRGVFPAATTEFSAEQALDIPATLDHVDRMIAAGAHGLIMLGTVGENCSLEPREKLDVLRATVEHVAGRVPVLTGVAVMDAIRAQAPDRFAWREPPYEYEQHKQPIDILAGSPALREAIDSGERAELIAAGWPAAHTTFLAARERALLYT